LINVLLILMVLVWKRNGSE